MSADKINTNLLLELKIREGCCSYCGRRMKAKEKIAHGRQQTIDHVIPKSNGGTDSPLNRIPCCFNCNQWKAGNSLEYFITQIEHRLAANVFSSKNSRKRWEHMVVHTTAIKKIIDGQRREIYKYKPVGRTTSRVPS